MGLNDLDQLATKIWVKFVVFEVLPSFADIPTRHPETTHTVRPFVEQYLSLTSSPVLAYGMSPTIP